MSHVQMHKAKSRVHEQRDIISARDIAMDLDSITWSQASSKCTRSPIQAFQRTQNRQRLSQSSS